MLLEMLACPLLHAVAACRRRMRHRPSAEPDDSGGVLPKQHAQLLAWRFYTLLAAHFVILLGVLGVNGAPECLVPFQWCEQLTRRCGPVLAVAVLGGSGCAEANRWANRAGWSRPATIATTIAVLAFVGALLAVGAEGRGGAAPMWELPAPLADMLGRLIATARLASLVGLH